MPRRSPRALALWGAALVVAVVTAAIVAGDLAALHRRAADLGPEVDAVVAARDLPVGTVLDDADLGTRAVHRSQLPDAVVTDRVALVGRVVAVPVVEGAYVASRNVAPRRRTGLDGVVPRGMRAIRVVVTDALEPRAGRGGRRARHLRSGSGAGTRRRHDRRRGGRRHRARVDRRAGSGAGRAGAAGVTLLVDPEQARAPRRRPGQRRRHPRARSARGRRAPLASASLSVLHAIILGIVQGLSEFLPDLLERSPDPRAGAVRLDRAHVERLAQQDVRRRAARRHARSRCSRTSGTRSGRTSSRRGTRCARAPSPRSTSASRGCCSSPPFPARSSARCSPA